MYLVVRVSILSLALLVSSQGTLAQEATPSTSGGFACTAPELPPGTPTSLQALLAEGTESPEELAGAPLIPRIGDDRPAPAPPPDAQFFPGSPTDDETASRVVAAMGNLFACLRNNDYLAFGVLVTPAYRVAAFGTDNPYNADMSLQGYPDVTVLSIGNVLALEDGRLSVDVSLVFGGNQVYRFQAIFVASGENLLLDDEIPLPFDNADMTASVLISPASVVVQPGEASSGSLIAFDVTNTTGIDLEVSVIRIPEGMTGDDLQGDPALLGRVSYVGGVFAPFGETWSFAVANLSPGRYTVIAVGEDDAGEPEIAPGMIASFDIR